MQDKIRCQSRSPDFDTPGFDKLNPSRPATGYSTNARYCPPQIK